jgi:hypothetical protein
MPWLSSTAIDRDGAQIHAIRVEQPAGRNRDGLEGSFEIRRSHFDAAMADQLSAGIVAQFPARFR